MTKKSFIEEYGHLWDSTDRALDALFRFIWARVYYGDAHRAVGSVLYGRVKEEWTAKGRPQAVLKSILELAPAWDVTLASGKEQGA